MQCIYETKNTKRYDTEETFYICANIYRANFIWFTGVKHTTNSALHKTQM